MLNMSRWTSPYLALDILRADRMWVAYKNCIGIYEKGTESTECYAPNVHGVNLRLPTVCRKSSSKLVCLTMDDILGLTQLTYERRKIAIIIL